MTLVNAINFFSSFLGKEDVISIKENGLNPFSIEVNNKHIWYLNIDQDPYEELIIKENYIHVLYNLTKALK